MANVAQLVALAILAMMAGSLAGCGGCDKDAVKKNCGTAIGTDCKSCGEELRKCCDEKGLAVMPDSQTSAQNELTGKQWFDLAKTGDSACKTQDGC